MKNQSILRLALRAFTIAGPLATAGCATTQSSLPDRFTAGRDSDGSRCTAIRTWKGAGVTSPQDIGYIVNCGGVAASRAQAIVSVVPVASQPSVDSAGCGAAGAAELRGVGAVDVRRCNDPVLKASAVVVSFARGGKSYRGAAIASALGPLENALAALVNGTAPSDDSAGSSAQIKLDGLAPAPQGTVSLASTIDPALVLREGISLNRQGRYVEASRLLNDGLSGTDATTRPEVAVDLLLEAGLADSNIRFADAAKEHFDAAAALLDRNATMAGAAFLQRKRAAYAALDSLNRRDYQGALRAAATTPRDAVVDPNQPLESPVLLAELNRTDRASDSAQARLAGSIGGSKTDLIQNASLNAQLGWARSVALLAQNRGADAAEAALAESTGVLQAVLNSNIDPAPLTYLVAVVERQAGRISARRAEGLTGEARAQAYKRAIGQFDCGLSALLGQAAPDPAACAVQLSQAGRARLARVTGGISPVAAETQIERAALRVTAGAGLSETGKDFADGIDTLISSGRAGSLAPSGLETYLNLLADSDDKAASGANVEAFFRAVQAVGEPGIARQLSQLQSVVSADAGSAPLLRERADLNREIPALRYQIEALGNSDANSAERQQLTSVRDAKLKRLEALSEQLVSSGKLNAVDDTPVTIDKLQKTLLADEVYFKLIEVRGYSYGMVVSRDKARIYRIDANLTALTALVNTVRASIRENAAELPVFEVARSASLFQLIAGPDDTRKQLQTAKQIVFDPSGPMSILPLGVLIADRDSVINYLQKTRRVQTRDVLNDYSKLGFLAKQAEIATALSPRSFIDVRGLKQSVATRPFLGIGEHSAPSVALPANAQLQFGANCYLSRTELVGFSQANPPISAAKLTEAATAFGAVGAPEITGADFTDLALSARTDLDQFQVVHFATHGLPQRQYGCASIPPSLLTTIGGEGSDGFLSFSEVAGLKLNANLVVLSACDTSASTSLQSGRRGGQEDTGRALDGLVRAFLAANARAVVATYWEVSGEGETDQLFRAFYANGRTKSIGGALQAAQTTLIDQPRYSHPYYWGAYFMVGDESKTMLSGGEKLASR